MAAPDIGAPGPSAPSSSPLKYDVFLSFRGEDVRRGFVAHLYSALRRKGIVTFIDDEDLVREQHTHLYSALRRKGIVTFIDDEDLVREQHISDQIRQAIEQSQFSIVVLSENYFSSSWCLDELLAIMESKHKQGRTIYPVFYDVDAADVRRHRGSIAAGFEKHEHRFSVDKVRRWREALTQIANISGWDARNSWNDAEIVENIVEAVGNKLYYNSRPHYEDIFTELVGDIQSKVDKIIGLEDICFVGICGMGGLGKTTLARCVYQAVRQHFEASCFLSNIREVSEGHGLVYLQRMLLSNLGLEQNSKYIHDCYEGQRLIRHCLCHRKVLIILDDVSDKRQLESLAGHEEWFGMGSKIIITTRDKYLLRVYKQFEIYEVGTLDPEESLLLFCRRAFKKNEPEQGYWDLSKEIIETTQGVPLALEVLGSFLSGRTPSEWRDALDRFREHLPEEIYNRHRISYDGLDYESKMAFLDIACFFNGRTKFEVTNILEICGFHPIIEIQILIEKSLLSSTQSNSNLRHDRLQKMRSDIFLPTYMYHKLLHEASQESLCMNNFLQEMGRKVVIEGSPNNAGRRSRLWNIDDIDYVLKENMGTKAVRSIVVDLRHPFKAKWHPECFSNMPNLILLDLSKVELSHNLNHLPRALKFLRWDCYALKSLPPVDVLHKLVSLQLRSSNITRLWDGAAVLFNLRTIDVSNSDELRETPDFSATPNLEKLYFNYCENLIRVHESVGQLKKLVELSLRFCTSLETLTTFLDMDNLEVLILGECFKLEKLPEFSENMRRLYFLDLRNTEITEIPLSIINLGDLKYLDLSGCSKLKSIPELPPNSTIRANKDPFLASTLDLQLLIESCVSKHHPIHLVIDSKGKEEMPPWFEQQELRHCNVASGEVVTITADIPSDLANYEGIAVCIIFECLSEEAWRGFSIDWKFQDYNHTNDKNGGLPRPKHADKGSEVDSTAQAIHSKITVDVDKLQADEIFSFEQNPEAEIECRVYKGFFPIDKEKCRQHPSGVGSQVDLTLCFPTTNTIGKVVIHSKETSFGDLKIVDGGWRLVCKKHLVASSERIRHEAETTEDKLGDEMPYNFEHLVGDIQSKVDMIIALLKIELDETCFVGIWGESGIGKTTLARLVYEEMQSNFEVTCFLDNVREDSKRVGIVSLQKRLLSELGFGERDIDDFSEGTKTIRKFLCHKKVLIILNDVSQRSQIENLAGNKEWFGAGSKIVITARDITLLTLYEQFEEYEVGRLHPDESLKLLRQEAFGKHDPELVYLHLSEELIKYACGLPLVLKVVGSFLFEKDEDEWRNALKRLRENPSIFNQLRVCYDGLEDEEHKRLFLDIACFFNKEANFKVTNILKLCDLDSTSGIEVLIEKSMLNFTYSNSNLRQNENEDQDMLDRIQRMRRDIFLPTYLYDWLLQEASKEYLYMHDLLQEMGRDIVFKNLQLMLVDVVDCGLQRISMLY